MSYVQVGGGWNNGPNPFQAFLQKLSERQDYHQQTLLANHRHAHRMEEHAYLHQTAHERIYAQGSADQEMATHKAGLDRETFAATSAHESRMSAQESHQRMAESTHAATTLSGFSGGRAASRVSLPGGASVEFPSPVKKAAEKKTAVKKTTVAPAAATTAPKATRKSADKASTKPAK